MLTGRAARVVCEAWPGHQLQRVAEAMAIELKRSRTQRLVFACLCKLHSVFLYCRSSEAIALK